MYVVKVSDMYFTGFDLSYSQRDAKRYDIEAPTATFRAYLSLLMGAEARFVKLTSRADRIGADILADYDGSNNYDPSTF
jgi:hypothetical protein